MEKRKIEVSVISDLHLATHASKAKKILKYLKSIQPSTLVLNGDIIDSWRFSRSYFPKSHLKVIRHIIKLMEKGVLVYYITGNHDDFLRKFNHVDIGNLKIVNQTILELNGNKTWIFHGDVFDPIIHKSHRLAKFGAAFKGLLTVVNNFLNSALRLLNLKEVIIYKSIKNTFRKRGNTVSRFEDNICRSAAFKNCQTIICGHTHQPLDKTIINEKGVFRYINCGDWVEHFTAVEYSNGEWVLKYIDEIDDDVSDDEPEIPNKKEVYNALFNELTTIALPYLNN